MDDLLRIVQAIGVTAENIQCHSHYDGENPMDYLYVPDVLSELERQGFDSFAGWDILTNYEIPITVVFHRDQILTHKALVRKAVCEGEIVPRGVLAEYPDLVK